MRPYFEQMLMMGADLRDGYSSKSSLVDAIDYFTNHHAGLTYFLSNPDLPIDNNIAESKLLVGVLVH